MRFNAFNFAGMKKSTIWVLGIVMGLSFLSLLYLQVSYIEEMVKMRKGQFDESVQRSLVQACRNIELVETKKYLEDDAIATALCSSFGSITNNALGSFFISLIPPKKFSSFAFSFLI